jgi:hypothetical protein
MEAVTLAPSTLARHKQSWQRRCRRCVTRAKEAVRSWDEAQSAGLVAGNALVNDVMLLKALATSPTVQELDPDPDSSAHPHSNQGAGVLQGLREASLAKMRKRVLQYSKEVEQAFSELSQALELLRDGEKALQEEDSLFRSLSLEPAVSKKLQMQQPVFWRVTPSTYLSRVSKVVQCYERELVVKKHVWAFLSQLAEDTQEKTFHKEVMGDRLETQMKVQLVVWMLEPEIDSERYANAKLEISNQSFLVHRSVAVMFLQEHMSCHSNFSRSFFFLTFDLRLSFSVQDLVELFEVENKLCKRY